MVILMINMIDTGDTTNLMDLQLEYHNRVNCKIIKLRIIFIIISS